MRLTFTYCPSYRIEPLMSSSTHVAAFGFTRVW